MESDLFDGRCGALGYQPDSVLSIGLDPGEVVLVHADATGDLDKAVRRIGRGEFFFQRLILFVFQLRVFHLFFFQLIFQAHVSLSIALAHYCTWSFNWNFHVFSFSSLSKSCAMYETAVMVC